MYSACEIAFGTHGNNDQLVSGCGVVPVAPIVPVLTSIVHTTALRSGNRHYFQSICRCIPCIPGAYTRTFIYRFVLCIFETENHHGFFLFLNRNVVVEH